MNYSKNKCKVNILYVDVAEPRQLCISNGEMFLLNKVTAKLYNENKSVRIGEERWIPVHLEVRDLDGELIANTDSNSNATDLNYEFRKAFQRSFNLGNVIQTIEVSYQGSVPVANKKDGCLRLRKIIVNFTQKELETLLIKVCTDVMVKKATTGKLPFASTNEITDYITSFLKP